MIVEVVGAVIRDGEGRLLTVRKAGTTRFMLPGGKREPGEDDHVALARELAEELGLTMVAAEPLGVFQAAAANEPDAHVRSHAYFVTASGTPSPAAEIAELRWISVSSPEVELAPLLVEQILPRLDGAR